MSISEPAAAETAIVISGKEAANRVIEKVIRDADALRRARAINPGLAVVIVGTDPASQVYVAAKSRKAKECGFHSVQHELPANCTIEEILELLAALNSDSKVHGILVQLPLPKHIDASQVIQAISPEKDVDGFTFVNIGRLTAGDMGKGFVPCTPAGSMLLIESILGADLSGKHAVVLGRSNIVGKPIASLLLAANATVTVAHSRTSGLQALCRGADILVAAVGKPEMVRAEWIRPGALLIDVGINRIPAAQPGGKSYLVGDIAYDECAAIAGAITPVPGGVGPMTIAMLMSNTLLSACRFAGNGEPIAMSLGGH